MMYGSGGRWLEITEKDHLRLAFGCEGGGGGGSCIERLKITTSGSRSDVVLESPVRSGYWVPMALTVTETG
jgi:hypothetical protein